jgi:hypothetical protein
MINPSAKNTLAEKQTEASKQQAKTQGKKVVTVVILLPVIKSSLIIHNPTLTKKR